MTRISTKLAAAIAISVALVAGTVRVTSACGHCHGDKVAAVYDHAVLTKAKAAGHNVAYAEVVGSVPDDIMSRDTLRRVISAQAGVDKSSIRVSSNPPAVSFAFAPKKTTVTRLLENISKGLAEKKWTLTLLKTAE